MKVPSAFIVAAALALLFTVAPTALPQSQKDEPNSPVFKNKRPPLVVPQVPESDALDQIWQAFVVARKAQAGDKFAQHELGLRYITGRGVERDTAKAGYWFQKASEQGLTASTFNLAILAYHGWGVRWDPFESYKLIKQCAEAEMPEAEYFLAAVLTEDLVVPRDWKQAYDWAKKAADADFGPAKKALPEFAVHLTAASSKEKDPPLPFIADMADTARSPSSPRLLKDVFHGAGELRRALGISQMVDDSTRVDSVELDVVRRAARYGSPEALMVLGRCYERGIEVGIDSVEAEALYVRALRLDSPRALELILALLNSNTFAAKLKARTERGDHTAEFVTAGLAGLGIEAGVSETRAVQLLRRSADAGYVPAIVELGLWHYSGRWVEESKTQAKNLWYKAASLGSLEASIRLAVTALRDSTDPQMHSAQVALLRTAANEGSLLAEFALGYAYEQGIGTHKEPGEAASYYRLAASRGSQDAFRALRRMYDDIRPDGKEFKVATAY
ncbi:MAG: tetratricopeptide repeat protein [Bacteroidota bacterium]